MAESGQERNLPPSAKRLLDARREGQVPRSRDLAHLMLLGAAAGALLLLSGSLLKSGLDVFARGLRFDYVLATDPARMTERLAQLGGAGLLAVAPVLGVLLLAAVAAPALIGGWNFAPKAAAPKFDRLNPITGFGRLFSLQAVVELLKVIVVAILLGAVGAWYIFNHLNEFAGLAHESLPAALAHFGTLSGLAFLTMVATLAVTSSIDVPFQLFHHHSKLKMTMQELKEEMKEQEGDPHIKGRIKSQQREMARRRMMAAVPTADVVVTNPTHFAVALKYAEERHGAPLVVAKGQDEIAARIRELAAANAVPLVEAPPLARALYRHVDLGEEIPAALYTAVAQVLAYVFQLKAFAAGQAPRPRMPQDIEVPQGMDPLEPLATA
jgi:flagellar biosynthetic protein FlhB